MRNANKQEIINFKEQFCKNDSDRNRISNHFNVQIESFEELLPGKFINSYASGNRKIESSFIMLRVTDIENEVLYSPVFSESLGRIMLKAWGLDTPKKRSIFTAVNHGGQVGGIGGVGGQRQYNRNNAKLRTLILYARSLMIFHIDDPKPMSGILNDIYQKLERNPRWEVRKGEVKCVNTAIKNFLLKDINIVNENYADLGQYIKYLTNNTNGRHLRNYDFESLREILTNEYPDETIYF